MASPLGKWYAMASTQQVKNLPAMQEIQVQSLSREDPLEKGMTTHFNILAWKIPWTEELNRLETIGSQRVGHDKVIDPHTCTQMGLDAMILGF